MSEFIYKITADDLDRCWEFSLKYYLDETKPVHNRRVGSARGVGGIIDSFFLKIIEIAVCKNLEALSSKDIEVPPDLEIRPLTKGKTEPDVYKIIDKKTGKERDPEVYIEVKQLQSNHNWVGPTEKEIESISKNEFGVKDEKKMYYFWCEIVDSKMDATHSRRSSLLGSYLKHLAPDNLHLDSFHDFTDMQVEIKFIHSIDEIKQGMFFPEDTVLVDPEIFTQNGTKTFKKKFEAGDLSDYDEVTIGKNFPDPVVYSNSKEYSLFDIFGKVEYTGKVKMYLKKPKKDKSGNPVVGSKRYMLVCETPVSVTSRLGNWDFAEGEIWCYSISPSGAFPKLRNGNYLEARRYLKQKKLFHPSKELMQEIADAL